MLRPSLEELPSVELPAGYRVRLATEADQEGLSRVLIAAFDEPLDLAWVRKNLWEDPTIDEVWLIETEGGEIVATTTARRIVDRPEVGYVHWVGTHPSHGGKALGYWVMLAVLHAFARLGKTSAVLDTDDHRLPAIRTYFKLGFAPEIVDESHPERWRKVMENLDARR